MGSFKQPTLLGHDSGAVQDSFSGYLLGYTAMLFFVASRHVVGAWISNKMGTVGVQLPSGSTVVKFEDPEVYCDYHMTGAVFSKVKIEKEKMQFKQS